MKPPLDLGPIKDRIKKAEHESALFGLCDVVALVAEVEALRSCGECNGSGDAGLCIENGSDPACYGCGGSGKELDRTDRAIKRCCELQRELDSLRAERARLMRVVEAAKVLRNDPHVWDEENGSYIQCVEPFSCDLCKAFDAALSPSPASEPRP